MADILLLFGIATVNACFKGRLPPIKAVFEIFKAHQVRLLCWPELDCYGPRPAQMYVGPQLELNTGLQVE